jgi:hypothetical protein
MIWLVWLLFVVLIPVGMPVVGSAFAQGDEPEQVKSTELEQTIITPVMETPIVAGKNLVYCSTFQIVWNMLQDSIVGEDLRMVDQAEVVDLLNKQLSTTRDISEECYVAMVDWLSLEFLRRINDELKRKFGDNAPPEVVEPIRPGYFCYAFLFKDLRFPKGFESMQFPLLFNTEDSDCKVASFGINGYPTTKGVAGIEIYRALESLPGVHVNRERLSIDTLESMASLVTVYRYKDDDDFIIQLRSLSASDEIVLAKIQPKANLLETIEYTTMEVGLSVPDSLEYRDVVQIPKFNYNVKHSYRELMFRSFLNVGWKGWYIDEALQWTRFTMNEKGIVLASEARIHFRGGGAKPRRFVFDEPFLIYLKQKDGRYPYFAMWVDNAELMVKY